jgi:hypothetical protein
MSAMISIPRRLSARSPSIWPALVLLAIGEVCSAAPGPAPAPAPAHAPAPPPMPGPASASGLASARPHASAPDLALALAPAPAIEKIALVRSSVYLNGPWKFHLGDDPSWAAPEIDDSNWESVDLTPPPGAHDADVGLTGYVPGWGARGHAGYSGYAWYRLHITVDNPEQFALSLAGPTAVDSAYQVFLNGALLGSAGSGFSGATPNVVSIQPRLFAVPLDLLLTHRSAGDVIAFRVWMGPWDLDDPGAGGMHVAPALGQADAIEMLYEMQWLQTIRGYIVEVAEAVVFALLALMALSLSFRRHRDPYHWLAAALVLTALYRANQAVFFWGQFETVHAFEWISTVFLYPMCLAAWTLAWRAWLRLDQMPWLTRLVGALGVAYMLARFLTASWFHGMTAHWVATAADGSIVVIRLVFLSLTAAIAFQGVRRTGREGWLTLPALLLVSVGQFSQELSQLGVQGIWFPFGTGVSRAQFAYAAFDVVLFFLLLRRVRLLSTAIFSAILETKRA